MAVRNNELVEDGEFHLLFGRPLQMENAFFARHFRVLKFVSIRMTPALTVVAC